VQRLDQVLELLIQGGSIKDALKAAAAISGLSGAAYSGVSNRHLEGGLRQNVP
jgi:hypothetical protein